MSGIFQGSGILTINMCYFTTCTRKIPSHFMTQLPGTHFYYTEHSRVVPFSVKNDAFYCAGEFAKQKPTCNDVIDALWPCRTAKGAQVRRHQTLIILSQLPAAIMVFSQFTAISDISAACPLRVANNLPSSVAQIFTRQSSDPYK